MWSVKFWKDIIERVVATFCEALAGMLTVDGLGIIEVEWHECLSVAALIALASLLKGVGASYVGDRTSASLTDR